ncbi:hypothetical protein ACS0TY_025153 [Phlomoides rotata]
MAYNSDFFLIALLLFSTTNPLAHGQFGGILPPITIPPILRPIIPPITIPPIIPPITIPPVTLPPILRPITPPITLPPIAIPPVTLPPIIPPVTLPPTPGLIPTLLNGTIVTGTLCCTPTGTCPGTPVQGVLVKVNCTSIFGASVLVGQNTTDMTGSFNISIPNIIGVVPSALGVFPCNVTIALPLNETICPVFSAVDGFLLGTAGLINTILNPLLGLLQRIITISVFIRV